MLELAIFNIFSERTQPAPALVIINRKSKYKILEIVDFKIN